MKFDELIESLYDSFHNEATENYTEHKTLVVIDVQKEYLNHFKYFLNDFVDVLNRFQGNILYFFNGPDLGFETEQEMIYWLFDNGVEEDVINRISFRPKVYAFFRNWMDMGLDRDILIKCIRYMELHGKNDSRDVTEEEWRNLLGEDYEDIIERDMINLPDIDLQELKNMQPFYLCGGGRNECLEEFRIFLDAFNVQYHIIEKLVY